jgi:hypothetical protein
MRNLLMVLLLCISNLSQSQDISVVLKEAERLEAIPNEKEALKHFNGRTSSGNWGYWYGQNFQFIIAYEKKHR